MSATTWTVKRSLGSTALYSGAVSAPDATASGGSEAEYKAASSAYSSSDSIASVSAASKSSTSSSSLSTSASSYSYEDYLEDVYDADGQPSSDDDFNWWNPFDWAGALVDAVASVVGTVIDGFAKAFAWATAPVLEFLAEGFAAAIDAGAALVGTALEVLTQGASEVIEFFTGLDLKADGNYKPPASAEEIAEMNFFEYIHALTKMNASDLGQQFDLLGDLLNYLDDDDCSGDELPNVDFFDIAYKIGVAVALAAAGALAVGATTLLGGAAGVAIGKLFEGLGLDVGGDLLGFLDGFDNGYNGGGSHYNDRDNFLEHIFGDVLGGFGGGVIGDILGVVLHAAGAIAEPVLEIVAAILPIVAIGGAVVAGGIALKLAGLVIENRSDGAISGNAFDDIDLDGLQGDHEGYAGIAVVLLNPDGSVAYTKEGEEAIVYTDENGHYCFNNVIRGDYKIGFEVKNGKGFVDKGSSKDKDASDVNANSGTQTIRVEKEDGSTVTVAVKTTDTFKLHWDEHEKNIDAGYAGPNGLIQGRLTVDDDRDNTEVNTVKDDNNESWDLGLGGQVVQLLDTAGNVILETVTDKNGSYEFKVAVGNYRVQFPDDLDYASKGVGAEASDSDVNANGRTDLVTVTNNGKAQNVDASVVLASAQYNADNDSIRVFEDGDAGSVNLLANDVVTLSPKVEKIGNWNTPGGKITLDSNTGLVTFDPQNDFQSLAAGETQSFDVRYRVTDQSSQKNITVEAESLIGNSDDFREYASGNASGNRGIQLKDWKSDGWVKYDFTGSNGLYDLNLFIQDESDGQSEIDVEVNGKLLGDFELTKDSNGAGNNDGDYSRFVVSGLNLKRGDEVKVKFDKDGGEMGRFDKMVFSETITEARPATITIEAEDAVNGSGVLESDDLIVFNSSDASGGKGAHVKSRWYDDEGWLKVKSFQGASATYDVIMYIQDENDGRSDIGMSINGTKYAEFEVAGGRDGGGNDNGTFTQYIIADVKLKKGDEIKFDMDRDGGEAIRLDKIEFARPYSVQEATATITVEGVNDDPTAVRDYASTNEDTTRKIVTNILNNDRDVDSGDRLRITDIEGSTGASFNNPHGNGGELQNVTGDQGGRFEVRADGRVSFYTEDDFEYLSSGQTKVTRMTYTVSDNNGGQSTSLVSVTVNGQNDKPDAVDDEVVVPEDAVVVVGNVLANDTDIDKNDSLSVTKAAGQNPGAFRSVTSDDGRTAKVKIASNGTADVDLNGQFLDLLAGETDTITVSYEISDGKGGNDTATLTVTVVGAGTPPVNQAPDAEDDTGETRESEIVTGSVFDNDNDPDGDPIRVVSAENGADTETISNPFGQTGQEIEIDGDNGGVFTIRNGGSFSFDPDGDFDALSQGESDVTSVTYTISDGRGGTDTATLSVTVDGEDGDTNVQNTPPEAVDDSASVNEDQNGFGINLTNNDIDIDGDDVEILSVDTAGTRGNVGIRGDDDGVFYSAGGRFESLGVGESAIDTFTYTVTDGNGGTDSATVRVTVNGRNDGPDAANDAFAGPNTGPITGNVLSNDSDPDTNDTLAVLNPGTVTVTSAGGRNANVTINSNGQISVDTSNFGDLGFGAQDTLTLTYGITDGNGGNDTANVTVTVRNDASGPNLTDGNETDTVGEDAGFVTLDPDNVLLNTVSSRVASVPTSTLDTFDGGDTTGWNKTKTISLGGEKVLGNFGKGGVARKTFDLDPNADTAKVEFDFYRLDSWDNENFKINLDGKDLFSVKLHESGVSNGTVVAEKTVEVGDTTYTLTMTATSSNSKTWVSGWSDQKFKVEIEIDNPGDTVELALSSTLNQDAADESWAIDNVAVSSEGAASAGFVSDPTPVDLTEELRGTATASASSVGWGGNASKVIDGNTNGNNWVHTQKGKDEWVEVDLKDDYALTSIVVTNRGDNGNVAGRLNGAEVVALDASGNEVYRSAPISGAGNGEVFTFDLPPGIEAQFVRMEHSGKYLHVSEIQVFGTEVGSASGPDGSRLISSENFESGVSGWGTNQTFSNDKMSTVLGHFGKDASVAKTFTVGNADQSVIEFDFLKIDSWDNENAVFSINGVEILSQTISWSTPAGTVYQSGVVSVGGGATAKITMTAPAGTTQLDDRWDSDQIWKVQIVVDNPGTEVTLGVTSTLNQAADDEAWAIDNVNVFAIGDGGATAADQLLAGAVAGDLSVISVDGTAGGVGTAVAGSAGGFFIIGADGAASFDTAGEFEFLANGETAITSVDYVVQNAAGDTDGSTYTVTVTGANDGPTANADVASVGEDSAATSINLTANDTDPDNSDDLEILSIDPTGVTGSVLINSNGDGVRYNPNGQFESLGVGETATETFTYTVTDGNGGTATSSVTVTVIGSNDGPVAVDDAFRVDEDSSLTPSAPDLDGAVLSATLNDTDIDSGFVITSVTNGTDTATPAGDPFGVSGQEMILAGTGGGIFNVRNGGNVSFETNGEFEGLAVGDTATTSVTYTVEDRAGGSDTATITVTVEGRNDGPVAVDDAFRVDEDSSLTPSAPDPDGAVLSARLNDTDIDSPNTRITSVTNGTDTATPAGDPFGDYGQPMIVAGTGGGIFNVRNGGNVSFQTNGEFESLAVGDTATTSVTYTLEDGAGGTDTATITVTVEGRNDGPVAVDAAVSGDEDTPITGAVMATDVDGDALTFTLETGPSDGSVTVNPDGTFEYTPDADFNGTDTFTVEVDDGNGGTDIATVTVTVNPVNDGPVAVADTGTVGEDDPAVIIDLISNDTDVDGDTLSIQSIDTTGTLGSVSVNPDGVTVSYDPNGQFEALAVGETALDTFTYTVTDGNGGTATETVTVTIEGADEPNGAPTAADDAVQIAEDGVATLDLFADNGNGVDSDPDGDDLTVISAGQGGASNALVVDPVSGTASVTFAAVSAGGRMGNVLVADPGGPLNFAFDPAGGFEDLDTGETDTVTITYTVSDGNGATDTADVVVTVDGATGASGTVTTAGSGDRNIVVIMDASSSSVGFADAYPVQDFDGDGVMGTAADYMLSKIVDLAGDLAATDQLSVIPSGFNGFLPDTPTVVTFTAGTLNAASGDLAAQQAIFAPIAASYLGVDSTLDWEQSFDAANDVFQTSAGFEENKVIALVNSESTFEGQMGDIFFLTAGVEDAFADLTSGDVDADVDILVIDDSFVVPERLAVIDSDGMVDVDAGGFGLSSLLDPAPSVMSAADLIRFSISVDGVEAADIDLEDLTATADGFEFSTGALPDGTEYVATIGLDTDRDGIVDIERSQAETDPGATFSFALDAFVSDQSLIEPGLVGSAAADVLTGDAASNRIYGLGGDDQLFGAGGNDFLDGGAGTDSLTGGAGSDAFVFRKGDGETIITDYELGGVDVIDLEGLAFYGFAGVLSMASQVGDDTVFDFGDGDLLTLNGVDLSMLTEADLCFR